MKVFTIVFLILILMILGFIIAIGINGPYSSHTYKSTDIPPHSITGKQVQIVFEQNRIPYHLKTTVAEMLDELTYVLHEMFTVNNIAYWAVNRTLLGVIRHGSRIPWDDRVEFSLLNSDLIRLRPVLQQVNKFQLLKDDNVYRYVYNNQNAYPYIRLHVMDQTDVEIAICTQRNELGECSYADSYHRRREVFSKDIVFPLQQIPYKLEHKNIIINISCAYDPQRCLSILYGQNWENNEDIQFCSFVNNYYSKSILYRFSGISSFI